jgi:nucleotide sugar dehydrogenase
MNNSGKYIVKPSYRLRDVLGIFEETSKLSMPAGIAILTNQTGEVTGSITEGDIRRAIINGADLETPVEAVANTNPICFSHKFTFKEILDNLPDVLKSRGRRSQKFLGKIIITDDDNQLVRVLDYHQLWEQRVATHRHIVVLGLGYVGLTLAAVLAEEGFLVSGVDPDSNKINRLKALDSYVHEPGINEILGEQIGKNFHPCTEIPDDGDVFILSVGTPVERSVAGENPTPMLKYIQIAAEQVGNKLKPGNLVVLRSTVPIGTCRDIVLPILEGVSGLKCGTDFHLSFAPERTAEGKALKELRELPQIIGGYNQDSVEATAALFRELTSNIIRVSSLEAAETIKLVNNTFRDLIFAYSNHVSQIAAHFNIDIHEVIRAANQGYPRDPVPLPSPGVGGPCLTKDPFIFASVAKTIDMEDTLFEKSRHINESMHQFLVERIIAQLQGIGKDIRSAKILICGLAFKGHPETGDIRNSSAVEMYHLLKEKAQHIYGHDPVAEVSEIKELGIQPVSLYAGFQDIDAVLFLNNHRFYEKLDAYKMIRMMAEKPIVFDGWGLFRSDELLHAKKSIYMGISMTKSSIA